MSARRRLMALVVLGVVLVALAVILSGGGGSGGQLHSAAPSRSAIAAALAGSPAVLAALHGQADRLLSGGTGAFEARLRQLRGYPVVINKWASWCEPCQSEFPAYQRAALVFGRRVAFIGIDGKDSTSSAAAFLRRFPVTYPSYSDPQEDISRRMQVATYYPQTVYIDRKGAMVFDHAGPYESAAALEHDIRRYALG